MLELGLVQEDPASEGRFSGLGFRVFGSSRVIFVPCEKL